MIVGYAVIKNKCNTAEFTTNKCISAFMLLFRRARQTVLT